MKRHTAMRPSISVVETQSYRGRKWGPKSAPLLYMYDSELPNITRAATQRLKGFRSPERRHVLMYWLANRNRALNDTRADDHVSAHVRVDFSVVVFICNQWEHIHIPLLITDCPPRFLPHMAGTRLGATSVTNELVRTVERTRARRLAPIGGERERTRTNEDERKVNENERTVNENERETSENERETWK